MIDWATVVTNKSGTFPNVLAINSSGAATPDGTEFIAGYINNGVFGPTQALMDYANLTPNGVTEAAGASQLINAIQLGNGIGPGVYVQWGKELTPNVTGDRVLFLNGQGVLISQYPLLDAACYVGDAGNAARHAAGGKFYRSSDAGGTTPNIAGPYLQLPLDLSVRARQYLGSLTSGDFIVSTTTGTIDSLIFAVIYPYRIADGTWRAKGRMLVNVPNVSRFFFDLTFSGLSFAADLVNVNSFSSNIAMRGTTSAGSGSVTILHSTSSITDYRISFDIELLAKPTWADDFEIKQGITY